MNETKGSSTSLFGSATIVINVGSKFEIDWYNMVGCELITLVCLGECTILCDESISVYCPKVTSRPGSCPSESDSGNVAYIGCDGLENSLSPTKSPITNAPSNSPITPPTATPTDLNGCRIAYQPCSTTNCVGVGENPHCQDQQPWGCAGCQDEYWFLSFDHPCVACDIIENCLSCNSWSECQTCQFGYTKTYDSNCGFTVCQ